MIPTKHRFPVVILLLFLFSFKIQAGDFSERLIKDWKMTTCLRMEKFNKGSSSLLFPPIFISGSVNLDSVQVSSNSDDAKEDIAGGNIGARTTGGDLDIGEGYSGSGTSPTITGVRFRNVSIPKGAIITQAYIKFTARSSESGTCNLQFWGEKTDDAVSYANANPAMSTRPKTSATVEWNSVPNWVDLNVYETPNLSKILQEIIEEAGWESGNDVSILMEGDDRREAYTHNYDPTLAPELVFDYSMPEICGNKIDDDGDGDIDEDDSDCFSPAASAVQSQINANSDDAEEDLATGAVSVGSSDLEMTTDGSKTQAIGLRFKNITVPKGANIINAYIKFTADESQSTATSLTFAGHADVEPKNFSDTQYKINDRPKTSATVDWNNIEEWTETYSYKSPNLASIVQEIVDLDGWINGNNIAFIITGTGHRTADSYDGNAATAPLLVVEYDDTPVTANLVRSYTQTLNSSEFFSYDPDPTCSSPDWLSYWTKFSCPDGFWFEEYDDGSAIMYGTMVSITDNCDSWDIYIRMEDGRNWTDWSGLGRTYYDGGGGNCTANRFDWMYYEIDSTTSRFTGTLGSCNETKIVTIKHNPPDYSKGTQVGFGASNCGGICSCYTYDVRGWFRMSGDLNLPCGDFGLNLAGYEEGNSCSLINGGFEDGFDFWYPSGSGINISNDAYVGTKSVSLSGDEVSINQAWLPAVSGQLYTVSGWGKLIGTTSYTGLSIRFFDKDRNALSAKSLTLNSLTWQPLNGGAVAPANTHYISLDLYKGIGGTAIYDEFCLEITEEPAPPVCSALANSDFETFIDAEWSPWGNVSQTTDAMEGSNAALISSASDGGIGFNQSVSPGKTYFIEFWAKQTGAINWAGANLAWYDADWNWIADAINQEFSSSYERRSTYADAPANAAFVQVSFSKYGTGDLYIDDVCWGLEVTPEICDNNVDDDGDGKTDCEDEDCAGNYTACPSDDCEERPRGGLIALYNFKEGAGDQVLDVSDVGTPLNLTIADPANVSWIDGCGLSINSGTVLESATAATKIIDSVKATNAITIEAWVAPENVTQSGPSRMVSVSNGAYDRNFTLGQDKTNYNIRFRTNGSSSTDNGYPSQNVASVSPQSVQHVVYTWDGTTGEEIMYIDGNMAHTGTRTGNVSNWDDTYKLALANEVGTDRIWLGEMYSVAIYNRVLSALEVTGNNDNGPCCEGKVYPIPEISCEDGQKVDFYYKGINNSVPATLAIPDEHNVDSILVEIIYKGGTPGSTVDITDNAGNVYTFSQQLVGGSAYIFTGIIPPTSSITYSNQTNDNDAQSIHAHVYRSGFPGTSYVSEGVLFFAYNTTKYVYFDLPERNVVGDVHVSLPISEITYDDRGLELTLTAGSQTVTVNKTWGPNGDGFENGCCVAVVDMVLTDVPMDVEVVELKVYSPPSIGQSYVIAGKLFMEVECQTEEICDNGIDDDGDGLIDCNDPDCGMIENAEFDNGTDSWSFGANTGNTANFTIDNTSQLSGENAAFVDISAVSGTNWHLQLYSPGKSITANKNYSVTFDAKAVANRDINVSLQRMNPPYTTYWWETTSLTPTATGYAYDFQLDSTNIGQVGLIFHLGESTENVWIDNARFWENCPDEICGNGIDDDADGLTDMADPDCPALDPQLCFLISDGQGDGWTTPDTFYTFNHTTGAVAAIGPTGTKGIEAMAMNAETGVIYTSNLDSFGVVNPTTGIFSTISDDMGTVNGANGSVNIHNLDGMAYDATNHLIWATERAAGGDGFPDDLMVKIDPSTGLVLSNGFGAGIGYVVVSTPEHDIDGLAMADDGTLYGISNFGASGDQMLGTIDKSTGAWTPIGDYGIKDVESLAFTGPGQMIATTGEDGSDKNGLYTIDAGTAKATFIGSIEPGFDVEACECRHGGLINLQIGDKVWADVDGDGLQGLEEPGVANVVVHLLDDNGQPVLDVSSNPRSTTTNAQGEYVFDGLTAGDYIVEFELPTGATFTTSNAGDDALDSDADASTGRTPLVSIAGSTNNMNADAGLQGVTIVSRDCSNAGELFVVDDGAGTINRFDQTNGAALGAFITGLDRPRGIVVGTDDRLYVSEHYSEQIKVFSLTTGVLIKTIDDELLYGLSGMTVGANGFIYANTSSSDDVKIYDPIADTVGVFIKGSSGGLDSPRNGIAFGPDGNLYVVSKNSDEVLRFNGTTGAFIDAFVTAASGLLNQPYGLVFGPDENLYITSKVGDKVVRVNGGTGAYIDDFVTAQSGGLDGPVDLMFGADGHLYVTSQNGSEEVYKYDGTTGDFISVFTSGLDEPAGLLFAPSPSCVEICDDGEDNDGDGLIDCDDPECTDGLTCDCADRPVNGLVALYTFKEGAGDKVYDISGVGTAVDLTIADPSKVSWLDGCGLSVNQSTVIESANAATKIIDAIKASNAITIESWVMPQNTTQDGPARMVTLSNGSVNRNFTLGQTDGNYNIRFRTDDSSTTNNGTPTNDAGSVSTVLPQHVLYTWNGSTGEEAIYIDGTAQYTGTRAGAVSNWDDTYKLAFANEVGADRSWLGDIYSVAIYDRPFTPTEVAENSEFGPCCKGKILPEPEVSCGDGIEVDFLYMGINDAVPASLTVADVANVDSILVEIIYKGGNPGTTIDVTDHLGNIYTLDRVFIGGTAYIYAGKIPATSSINYSNESEEQHAQSMHAHVYRSGLAGRTYITQDIYIFSNNSTKYVNFDLPERNSPRDIKLQLPVSEITYDNRSLQLTATVGSQSVSVNRSWGPNGYGFENGCCVDLIELELLDVPADEDELILEIHSPGGGAGQSYVVAGKFFLEVECYDDMDCENAITNNDFDAGTNGWTLSTTSGTEATLSIDNESQLVGENAAKINFDAITGTDWHVQLSQGGFNIEPGKLLEVSFDAKAAADRDISIGLQREGAPWTTFWYESVSLTTTAAHYSFTFTSDSTAISAAKLLFNLGETADSIWLDNINYSVHCPVEICDNDIDDDLDGYIDCNDPDCSVDGELCACPEKPSNGLLAFYNFKEGSGNEVYDVSGVGTPLNLTIANEGNISWLNGCGLTVNYETVIQSVTAASKIIDSVKASNAITVEAWVKSDNLTQDGPARLVTLSNGSSNRNFTLGQEFENYNIRFRTDDGSTTNNGIPSNDVGNVQPNKIQHVVMTWDGATGMEYLYVDGFLVHSGARVGQVSNWDDNYKLAIANEIGASRDWLGDIYSVAIYNRAFTATEVWEAEKIGPCCETPENKYSDITCEDGKEVEIIYTGLKNDLGKSFSIANSANVDSILIEIIYDGGHPGNVLNVYESNFTVHPIDRQTIWDGTYLYSAILPATSAIHIYNSTNEDKAQSGTLYVYRSSDENKSYVKKEVLIIEEDNSTSSMYFDLPDRSEVKDLTLKIPVSELDYNNDELDFTLTAGPKTVTVNKQWGSSGDDFPDGCCLDIVEITLENVPANVAYTTLEINSSAGSGQSYAIAGTLHLEMDCKDAEICGDGLDNDEDGLIDSVDPDCPTFETCDCSGENLFDNPSYESGTFGGATTFISGVQSDDLGTNWGTPSGLDGWNHGPLHWVNATNAADGSKVVYINNTSGGAVSTGQFYDIGTDVGQISTCAIYQVCFNWASFNRENPNGRNTTSQPAIDFIWLDASGTTISTTHQELGTPVANQDWDNLIWSQLSYPFSLSGGLAPPANATSVRINLSEHDGQDNGILLDNTSLCVITPCGPEICDDGVDNDSDGLTDCADPDCNAMAALSNISVSDCIDHVYSDVATVDVEVTWTTIATDDVLRISMGRITRYISVDQGESGSQIVQFLVPANGSTDNNILLSSNKGQVCQNIYFDAPVTCSNTPMGCAALYITGSNKMGDDDAWDRGFMAYLDNINASTIWDAAYAKKTGPGLSLYNPYDINQLLSINLNDYDLIILSPSLYDDMSASLLAEIRESISNVLVFSTYQLNQLGMASTVAIDHDPNVYDGSTETELYSYPVENPTNPIINNMADYYPSADVYLWRNASANSSGQDGVMFHYEAGDVLVDPNTNQAFAHGTRTFLGLSMDGVYTNSDNNGSTPVPSNEYFDPTRHLTLNGKYYLDLAIQLAANTCGNNPEICANGLDDDGDGDTDCLDDDCGLPEFTGVLKTNANNCPDLTNGQIVINATGSNLEYSIDNGATYQTSNTFSNLLDGEYIIRVRNSNSDCFVNYPTNPVKLTDPVCVEICDNNHDDDGNGFEDCDDPACGPTLSAGADLTVCIGEGTTIAANATGGNGGYTYTWDNSLGNAGSHFVNPDLGVITYHVTVEDGNGCYAIDSVKVTVTTCPEVCDDGIDNDNDGLFDCDDPDCQAYGQPQPLDDAFSTCPGVTLTEQVIFNDGNLQSPLFSIYQYPEKGMVTINHQGVFVYTPFGEDNCGSDEFVYQVCNQTTGCCNTATVALTIGDGNPPTLVNVPDDLTIGCDEELPPPAPVYGEDLCPGIYVSFDEQSTQIGAISCDSYVLHRIWEAIDLCGNIARDTQRIYVQDIISPEIFRRYTLANDRSIIGGVSPGNSHKWQYIEFPGNFNQKPIVFVQPVTNVEGSAVSARVRNVSESGFELALFEEEIADGIHAKEKVAWIAVEPGNLSDASNLHIGTLVSVTQTPSLLTYSKTFANTPTVLATMQTTNDAEPASLRLDNNSPNSVELWVQEEKSLDVEVIHGAEEVGYLAAATGLLEDENGEDFGELGTVQVNHNWKLVTLSKTYTKPVVVFGGATNNDGSPLTIAVRNVKGNSFEVQIDEWDYEVGTHADESIGYFVMEGSIPAESQYYCSDYTVDLVYGENLFAIDNCDNHIQFDYEQSEYVGLFGLRVLRTWSAEDDCGNRTEVSRTDTCNVVAFRLKASLYGAHHGTDIQELMRDDLREDEQLPMYEPYTDLTGFIHYGEGGEEEIDEALLELEGDDAVVDWVVIEVRNPLEPDSILHSKSGLLQRDGDIITAIGDSIFFFPRLVEGNYHVSLKHRNHLGLMTEAYHDLNTTDYPMIDFKYTSMDVMGGDEASLETQTGERYMWLGDINGDRKVVFQGPGNDIFALFSHILSRDGNDGYLANYISEGYWTEDVNMDGEAIYQGPRNDRAILLYHSILSHPDNTSYLANFIIVESLP